MQVLKRSGKKESVSFDKITARIKNYAMDSTPSMLTTLRFPKR